MEKIKADNFNKGEQNDSSLQRIGNFIKEARISKNLSLSDLASDLKISEQRLTALEEGRTELLPETFFIKAMLKRISEKLKLDTNFIINEFQNKKDEIKKGEIVDKVSKEKQPKRIRIFFYTIIIFSGIIGLLTSSLLFNIFSDMQYESSKKDLIQEI